jgi:hypothetical protein
MGQVFEAGEVFVRKHARAFGDSAVPFALELIEPERLVDEFLQPVPQAPLADGAVVKMGIEVDRFGRPLAYWIRNRHPGDLQFLHGEINKVERVPAEQIMHLRLVDRWPQTRGEPWLHAVARKLNDMDGYSEAEIVAARGAASYVFTIETPEPEHAARQPAADGTTAGADVSKEIVVEAGMGVRLAPGEKWETHSPNRPNTALDPFMRYMLREVAAGTGVSYESLSRDYSQSNYSSSRLALLDDRDLWKMLQQWFIRNFREPLHREWLRRRCSPARSPASRSPNTRSTPPSSRRRASSRAAGAGSTRPRKSRPPRKPSRRLHHARRRHRRDRRRARHRGHRPAARARARGREGARPRVRHLAHGVHRRRDRLAERHRRAADARWRRRHRRRRHAGRAARRQQQQVHQERPAFAGRSTFGEVSMAKKSQAQHRRDPRQDSTGSRAASRPLRASAKRPSAPSDVVLLRAAGRALVRHGDPLARRGRGRPRAARLRPRQPARQPRPGRLGRRDRVGAHRRKDKVGRATVRFGSSARATEVFNDVRDGILSSVSVGYRRMDMKLTRSSEEDGDEYTVTRWMPFEVSLVTIPADETVGVGRAAETDPFNPRQIRPKGAKNDP